MPQGKGRWRAVPAASTGPVGAGAPNGSKGASHRTAGAACSSSDPGLPDQGLPVAVVGGGLAGLACGWALKRKGIPAVIFDTGKRAPGGRASSRRLNLAGEEHIVDHAVQTFTAQGEEVKSLVKEMEKAGAVQQWSGRVGHWKDGKFQPLDTSARPVYIGNREAGMGAIARWLATDLDVQQDVWVAGLGQDAHRNWQLKGTRGQQIGRNPAYSYVVVAHNGKCADRLINTAPMKSLAHAPLRCRFTSTPSRTSDRLELSSLWVCILQTEAGIACFDGAFVEEHAVLSWAGNNSAKYSSSASASKASGELWTLISTPEYGSKNKCPQEFIPDDVRDRVGNQMRRAFAEITGSSRSSSWKVHHLQLWGAALPLNVCEQHFIHDPEARVGVCGDWLSKPSVEGALFSGMALGEAIAQQLGGGLRGTPVKAFQGLTDCHAIGDFGGNDASKTTAEVVVAATAAGASAENGSVKEGKAKGSGSKGKRVEAPPEGKANRWQRDSAASAAGTGTLEKGSSTPIGSGRLCLRGLSAFAVRGGSPLVDIGANLTKCSPEDLAAQLVRAAASRVDFIVLTGTSIKASNQSCRLCEEWSGELGLATALAHLGAAARAEVEDFGLTALPKLFFTAGVHPHDAKSCDSRTLETLRKLASHPQCVAIGECGLDYDRMFTPRDVQLEWCKLQVELAVELDKPLFLHERDKDAAKGKPLGSFQDMLRILSSAKVSPNQACLHCFTGPPDQLKAYVEHGYAIGLTGFVGMRTRGWDVRESLKKGLLPVTQLMIETDCPFMMPDKGYLPTDIGMEGRKNEPCAMPAVCRAAAECLGVPDEEVAAATTAHAKRFFRI